MFRPKCYADTLRLIPLRSSDAEDEFYQKLERQQPVQSDYAAAADWVAARRQFESDFFAGHDTRQSCWHILGIIDRSRKPMLYIAGMYRENEYPVKLVRQVLESESWQLIDEWDTCMAQCHTDDQDILKGSLRAWIEDVDSGFYNVKLHSDTWRLP